MLLIFAKELKDNIFSNVLSLHQCLQGRHEIVQVEVNLVFKRHLIIKTESKLLFCDLAYAFLIKVLEKEVYLVFGELFVAHSDGLIELSDVHLIVVILVYHPEELVKGYAALRTVLQGHADLVQTIASVNLGEPEDEFLIG